MGVVGLGVGVVGIGVGVVGLGVGVAWLDSLSVWLAWTLSQYVESMPRLVSYLTPQPSIGPRCL